MTETIRCQSSESSWRKLIIHKLRTQNQSTTRYKKMHDILHHHHFPTSPQWSSPSQFVSLFPNVISQNIRYCDDALELDPLNPKAYFRRSAGHEAKRDFDKVNSSSQHPHLFCNPVTDFLLENLNLTHDMFERCNCRHYWTWRKLKSWWTLKTRWVGPNSNCQFLREVPWLLNSAN